MKLDLIFLTLAGDKRNRCLAKLLNTEGYSCTDIASENIHSLSNFNNYNVILGPIPFFKNNHLNDFSNYDEATLISVLPDNCHVFGGLLPDTFISAARKKNITCHDYMKDELVTEFNTIATAEGLISYIISDYPENIHRKPVLLLGYGRCSEALAIRLSGLNCKVTICARNDLALSKAYNYGYNVLKFAGDNTDISNYPIIINTIPALVLTKALLSTLSKETYIYDIASKPGGVDYAYAANLGLHASIQPSLPGKYAPVSSAKILYNYIKSECEVI